MTTMTPSPKRSLILATLLLALPAFGLPPSDARACSTTTPLTFYNGYVDGWAGTNLMVYPVYWGFATYGDPQSFANASAAVLGETGAQSFGVPGTRWFGAPTQYSGWDYGSPGFRQIENRTHMIAPAIFDETGLPPPDGNGTIFLDEDQLKAKADSLYLSMGLDQAGLFGDEIMMMLPPNVIPPVDYLCGRHESTPRGHVVAWITYPGLNCDLAGTEATIVHELTETATNPVWDMGPQFEGWDQGQGAVCEIGDICWGTAFTVQLEPSNSAFSRVTSQQMLSNEAVAAGVNGCVYGRQNKGVLFGIGTDNQLKQIPLQADTGVVDTGWEQTSWGSPSGATLTGTPGAASWGPGRLDAFVRDTMGRVYHASSEDGGAVSWESLPSGSSFTQSPDAVSWGAGNLQVFGVRSQTIVKNTKDYPGGWSGWTTVNKPSGVNPVSKVTVTSWGATNVNAGVFPTTNRTVAAAFRGNDGKVWLGTSTNNGSFTWHSFNPPATLTGDLDISAWAPPRLDLFVLDNSGNLWAMSSNDGTTIAGSTRWNPPSQGGFQVGATAAGMGDGRLIAGGRVGGSGGTAYLQLWNWQATVWTALSGGPAFKGGVDVASW